MKALLRALGTQFNTEKSKMEMIVERPPFEADLRKIIRSTKQVIKTTTRIRSWQCLFWSGYEEEVVTDYHVVHFLVRGDALSYTKRYYTEVVDPKHLEALYQESLFYVKGALAEDEYYPEITG
ncbi:hypothetical protein D3C85_90110 [compost metagenome]